MIISSVLKYRINNGPAMFDAFTDGNLETEAAKVPGANLNDFIVLCHLSEFFEGYSDWYGVMPYRGGAQNGERVTLGMLEEGDEVFLGIPPHPQDSLSVVGFSPSSLRARLSQYGIDINDPEGWPDLIEGKSISEIEALLRAQLLDSYTVGISISETPITLKIARCDEEDLDLLALDKGASYTDAFDLVKDSLIGNVDTLNQQGFSQARYIADGDYIEFVSHGSIIFEYDAGAT